jgi:hypothetical protein
MQTVAHLNNSLVCLIRKDSLLQMLTDYGSLLFLRYMYTGKVRKRENNG